MFVLSKQLSAITQPMFWLTLWWAVALLLRWRRPALWMLWDGLVVFGLLGFRALPDGLLSPLVQRYPVQNVEVIDRHVGIIVLGGAVGHQDTSVTQGQVALGGPPSA